MRSPSRISIYLMRSAPSLMANTSAGTKLQPIVRLSNCRRLSTSDKKPIPASVGSLQQLPHRSVFRVLYLLCFSASPLLKVSVFTFFCITFGVRVASCLTQVTLPRPVLIFPMFQKIVFKSLHILMPIRYYLYPPL